jgi:hypothetical protein
LPYHDIKLIMFGGAVKTLVDAARSTPDALAGRAPVFTYRAPDTCGAGGIEVHLSGESKTWTPENAHGRPDALVACNAGLGSYPDWVPVVRCAHQQRVPFGVTEYTEQSAEHQVRVSLVQSLRWV